MLPNSRYTHSQRGFNGFITNNYREHHLLSGLIHCLSIFIQYPVMSHDISNARLHNQFVATASLHRRISFRLFRRHPAPHHARRYCWCRSSAAAFPSSLCHDHGASPGPLLGNPNVYFTCVGRKKLMVSA